MKNVIATTALVIATVATTGMLLLLIAYNLKFIFMM